MDDQYKSTVYRGFWTKREFALVSIPAHAAIASLWLLYATWGSGMAAEIGSRLWFPATALWFGWPVFVLAKRRFWPESVALLAGFVLLLPAVFFLPLYIQHLFG